MFLFQNRLQNFCQFDETWPSRQYTVLDRASRVCIV